MSTTTIRFLTPEKLCDLMRRAGYRVEIVRQTVDERILRSSTGALPFEVRFCNATPGDSKTYTDIVFISGLLVPGGRLLETVNHWNSTRRFARLHLHENHLVLSMDVVVLGGVSPEHMWAQFELWDRVRDELQQCLDGSLGKRAPSRGGHGRVRVGPRPGPAASPAA